MTVLALGARLTFWLVTDRVWEDALITIAHARNAISGIGLTNHPGEPVTHGFTSALSVLIPLIGEWISPGSGVTALRLASLAAGAVTIVAADGILRNLEVDVWPRRFALVFLAVDPLQIFYGMAGMETQVAVAALLVSVRLFMTQRSAWLGISFGVAILARPDFLLWVGPAILVLAGKDWRAARTATLFAAVAVAPWVVFTTLYYGSPVPQTIVAKSIAFTTPVSGNPIIWGALQAVDHVPSILRTFAPFYEDSLVVAGPVSIQVSWVVAVALWSLVAFGALVSIRRLPAAVAFLAVYLAYRALALPTEYFDWYAPPISALAVIIAAIGMSKALPKRFHPAAASILLVGFVAALPLTMGLERSIQVQIEDGVRQPVGEYLAGVVEPGDAVVSESAGYVGYYSGATIYDYPGLTSRTALAALRTLPATERTWEVGPAALVVATHAPWFVARPHDVAALRKLDPVLAAEYHMCRSWDSGTGPFIAWGPLVKVTVDNQFEVLHRGSCP